MTPGIDPFKRGLEIQHELESPGAFNELLALEIPTLLWMMKRTTDNTLQSLFEAAICHRLGLQVYEIEASDS